MLAEKAFVSQQAISNWENDGSYPLAGISEGASGEITLGEAYACLAERYPQLAFLMSDSEEDVTFRGSLYVAVDGHTSNCAVVDDALLVGPNSNVTFFMAYRGG